MINKFQQGGKLDAIMLFVLGLALTLLADPNQIIQIALLNPNALKSAVQTYQLTKDMNKAAQAFQSALQQLVQAAKHGAKLSYLKSLKHQCAEDEELVYYKKGGSVGCGCKKKEDGGEIEKAQKGIVANFKEDLKKKQLQNSQQQLQNSKWTDEKDNELKKLSEKKILTSQEQKRLQQLRNEFKNSSNAKNYEPEEGKKGMKIKKDCGGAVAKFKMHRLGGSLNGIPFYQEGTNKGGINGRGINGEYYYNPIPQGAGNHSNFPLTDLYNFIEEKSKTTKNPFIETGIVNTPGGPGGALRKLLSLGKPFKVVNGVNYYKNAAGELKTALEMAKELAAVKNAKPRSWFPRERHTDHYVPKNATGIYNELEKATYEGEQMMKNPFVDWRDFDEMNSVNYWKRGGFIKK